MAARICKKCYIYGMAEDDIKNIEKYREAIKEADRVSDDVYEKRIEICNKCDMLNAGTCGACGCYVQLRATVKTGRCPRKKWQPI